jgi:CheY-like chemotaxis protein
MTNWRCESCSAAISDGRTGEGCRLVPRRGTRGGRARFDVLILDVMLPDGSGIELCARLRSAGVDAPILPSIEDVYVQTYSVFRMRVRRGAEGRPPMKLHFKGGGRRAFSAKYE